MLDNESGHEHSERVSSESTSSTGVKYFLTKAGIVVFSAVVGIATASHFAFSLKPSAWQIILYLVLLSLVSFRRTRSRRHSKDG
jgi:hypothetical protein